MLEKPYDADLTPEERELFDMAEAAGFVVLYRDE
jgi:hypothetical protein